MATGSQNMTTYNARTVTGSNSAASPAGALLLSGAGRADDATGDTWLFLDSRGGTSIPWGIKHDQTDNKIHIYGNDIDSAWTRMNTGDTYILGKVGIGYDPEESENSYKLYVNGTSFFNNHIYLVANKEFYMQYNNAMYDVLHNHNNGNISINAASEGLYVAFYNTKFIDWMQGRMQLKDGCLSIFPNNGTYREGIRIHATGSWSDITLCGNDNTGDSGTSANSWFIGNNNGNFYITRYGSTSSNADAQRSEFSSVNNQWRLRSYVQAHKTGIYRSGLHIYGSTYGNTAADMASGTAGLFSWNDGGPQITFDTNATPGGGQAGALIFTDNDTAGAGVSWHFVSNQSDWNVTSKRFHARTSISIGTNLPNTSYNLYVNGSTYFNGNTTHNGIDYFANGTTYYINNSAVAYLNDLRSDNVRLVDSWIGFYQNANAGGNRYGYILADANRMYFRKENGVSTYHFDFNGHIYIPSTAAYFGTLGDYSSTAASDVGGLTWQNHNAGPSSTVNANDGPTSEWWYILRNRHTNTSNNYYTDLAIPFNANSIYYKIIRNNAIVNSGWVRVLDALNYNDYAPTKTGGGASGTWGISITGNAATATRINGNLAAATSDVNRNIWVSSTAGADGIPNYISGFNMNPSTKVFTVPAGTRISPSAGALYLGNSGNQSWVYVQDMCSQNGQKWKIYQNGNAEFTGTITAPTFSGTATSASTLASYASIGSSTADHGVALKNWFTANKSTAPRNQIISFYSATAGNGSQYMGYFLSGYADNPYGGFFVCHYNNPYYVGIQNGTYTQQHILTSTNYTSYTVTKTGGGASGTWGISITGSAGSVAWGNVSGKPATATRWPSWSEVTSKPSVQNNLTSTSTTDMLSAAQGKALNDKIVSVSKVVDYTYAYGAISSGGNLDITGTQLKVSTPSGYTPVAMTRFATGHPQVIPALFNARNTGSNVVIRLRALNAVTGGTAYISILYIRNS